MQPNSESRINSTPPHNPQRPPRQDRHGRIHPKPRAPHIRRRRDHDQPGITPEGTPALELRRQPPDLPQLIHGRENQPHGRGIDPPQHRQKPAFLADQAPEAREPHYDGEAGGVHGEKRDGGAEEGGGAGVLHGEGAEVDDEVEVGAGEGLDDGDAEEEVAG